MRKFLTVRKVWIVDQKSLHIDWPLESMELGDVIPLHGDRREKLRQSVMSCAYTRYHKKGTRRFISGKPKSAKPGVTHIQRVK